MLTATRLQRTIARETEVRGVGFLKGCDVRLRFLPEERADAGVVFVRSDLPDRPSVRAHLDNVVPRERRTTLQNGAAVVEMVEHVMAALAGLHIDNCRIEIDAPETPGCDGSSLAFVEALAAAGTVELDLPRERLVIDRPIVVREGKASLAAHPGDGAAYVLSYHLDYGPNNPIGSQSKFVDVTPPSFTDELAACRTFLLEAEAKALRQAGIGLRTTEADLLIFGDDGVIGNTLRFPDECVRHKILDMVGDLALLERDIVGHIVAHRSGHQLNAALGRALRSLESDPEDGATVPLNDPDGMDIAKILSVLPHRFPFLLVDRVLQVDPGKSLVGIKNVTVNEPFFQGHWPGRPIMPGVLIVEALAQAAGLMISGKVDLSDKITVLAAIDEVKIRKPVVPGDQLRLEVKCARLRGGSAHVQGTASVDGQLAAVAKMTFVMMDADRSAA